MAKETEKLEINGELHSKDLSSDREAGDEKSASNKEKEKQQTGAEESDLETFWRYYIV